MSFMSTNAVNHRNYNLLIEQMSSGPVPPTGNITPGPVTISGIQVSGIPVICAIDSDRLLIVYSQAFTFQLAAVVVDVSGAAPVFGTPVVITAISPRVTLSVRMVPGSTTKAVAFARTITQVAIRTIDISGLVITVPGAETLAAALTSPSRGYGEMLSASTGGVVIESLVLGVTRVSGAAITLVGDVVSIGAFSASTMFNMGGNGSRPLIDSGQLIQFGRDVSGSPAYLASVGFNMAGLVCTPTTVYVPPVVADRIRIDATFGLGSTIDVGGGVSGNLYQDFSTGSVASVRGAWSGTAASYSNSDSSPNILPALPYPPPNASAIQGYGQYSGTGGLGVLSQNVGGNISLYTTNTVGNVNMASAITLVATGANTFRSELDFNTVTKISFVYTVSGSAFIACGLATFS